MSGCHHTLLGICLTRPPIDTGYAIFGFSEFLAALALLVLVFSSSDFLYQFRVSIAPLPLRWISFVATVGIGVGTLLVDLWFAERWYALPWQISRASLQGLFGFLFLFTVLLWIWYAFLRPPVFGRWTYKRYYLSLFRAIVRGSESQLASLAGELVYSAEPLIRLWLPHRRGSAPGRATRFGVMAAYANDAILLLGNRKFCRHVVASAPITAIVLMEQAAKQKRFSIPLGGFARNVTEEALRNRDSILFHEDELSADVLGMVQPFSKAMYGTYQLVEGVGSGMDSPLDINWKLAWDMDGEQFDAYCRITLLTFKDYISGGWYDGHSYALYRAFRIIEGAGRELYRLDKQPIDGTDSKPVKRMSAAIGFVDDMVKFLGQQENLRFGRLRHRRDDARGHSNIFDDIAKLMFELVASAASVKSPPDAAWWIHYNTVWGRLFSFREDSEAWRVIRFKFSRLIFDEIKWMEEVPNYRGAALLGICLNVFGLTPARLEGRDRDQQPLRTAILSWTQRNYLALVENHPPVAESCLLGGISFDSNNLRLVKTYAQGLQLEPHREYLELDDPPN